MIVKKYKYFNEASQDEVRQQETLSKDSKKKGLSTAAKVLGVSAAGAGIGGAAGYGIGRAIGKPRDLKVQNNVLKNIEADWQSDLNFGRRWKKYHKNAISNNKKYIGELKDLISATEKDDQVPDYLKKKNIESLKQDIEDTKERINLNKARVRGKNQFLKQHFDRRNAKLEQLNKYPIMEERRRLSKKGAAIGALATAAAAAGTYGGYKLYKHHKDKKKKEER